MRTYSNSIVIQFDNSETGNAGSGKLVTVFETGTTTKALLFDVSLGALNNPVQADDSGNYTFTVNDGTYDIYIDYGLPTQTAILNEQISNTVDNPPLSPGDEVIAFNELSEAVNETNTLKIFNGAALNLKERTSGKGGGAQWSVVLASSVTPNTYNIVQCIGVPSLALRMDDDGEAKINKLGAIKDSGFDSASVIQFAVDNYDTVTADDGAYTIGTTVELRAGFGFDFPSRVSFHPNANSLTLFRAASSGSSISSLKIVNIACSGKSFDGATQYTSVTGLQINDAGFNVTIDTPRFSNLDTGINLQSNSFGVRILNPNAFLVENPVIFGATTGTNYISNPVFDNSPSFGGTGTGNGVLCLSSNKVEGGFIQGFDNGILVQGPNGKVEAENTYFETCPTAAINLDGVQGSFIKEIFHFGFEDSSMIKARNSNGIIIQNPKQATSTASIGLYDFDNTNVNCYASHVYFGSAYNLKEGIVDGLLKSALMGQGVIDTFTPRKTITIGVPTEMFRANISANHMTSFDIDVDAIESAAFTGVSSKKFTLVARNNAGVITLSAPTEVAGFSNSLSTASYSISADVTSSSPLVGVIEFSVTVTSSGAISPSEATARMSVKARTTSLLVTATNT